MRKIANQITLWGEDFTLFDPVDADGRIFSDHASWRDRVDRSGIIDGIALKGTRPIPSYRPARSAQLGMMSRPVR